jgi:hypothetical protein
MMLSWLFILAAISFGDAFAPSFVTKQSLFCLKSAKTPWDSVSNLAQLESQYQEVWQNTKDLMLKEKVIKGSRDIAETMLEAALRAVAFQRYKHQEIMHLAERQRREAIEERHYFQTIENEAHKDAAQARWEVDMLESIDAAYEDMERLRESARMHAAQNLEHDTHEMALEDAFVELEAEAVLDAASKVLDRVQEYENMLKASLKELNDRKMEDMRKGWKNKEP